MDKAFVIGAFDFIGFHLCKELLDKGYEVNGITLEKSSQNYIDEKRLEIGRNANFSELTMEEWIPLTKTENHSSVIIFSIYDLYMEFKDDLLVETTNDLFSKFANEGVDDQGKIVFLLPIQVLDQSKDGDGFKKIRGFIEKVSSVKGDIQFLYLPTIFGPWQPTSFLFQKIMMNPQEVKEHQRTREWKKDAVFVDDAVQTIVELLEVEVHSEILLESGVENQWQACAEYLKIKPLLREEPDTSKLGLGEKIVRLPVKKITPFPDSLKKQIDHLKYIKSF